MSEHPLPSGQAQAQAAAAGAGCIPASSACSASGGTPPALPARTPDEDAPVAAASAEGRRPGHHLLLQHHPLWGDALADQLIAASPAPVLAAHAVHAVHSTPLEVLQGARRCGRRFMRVFSDNLHNCYVDLLDSKHMMEFRARALKRRICRGSRKQPDNELYRSNSFKFERFERKDDPNDKQVRSDTRYTTILSVVYDDRGALL